MNTFSKFILSWIVLLFWIIAVIMVYESFFIDSESNQDNWYTEIESGTNWTDEERALLSEWITLYFDSEYTESITVFSELLKLYPDTLVAYTLMWRAFIELWMYRDALENYKTAIEFFPESHFFYTWKGDAFQWLWEYREAILQYQIAIEIDPDDSWVYFNKWIAKTELSMYRDAIILFDKAIKIEEDYINSWWDVRYLGIAPYVRKALALWELWIFKDILEIADKIMEIDRLDATWYLLKWTALQELWRFSDAQYYLNIAENL